MKTEWRKSIDNINLVCLVDRHERFKSWTDEKGIYIILVKLIYENGLNNNHFLLTSSNRFSSLSSFFSISSIISGWDVFRSWRNFASDSYLGAGSSFSRLNNFWRVTGFCTNSARYPCRPISFNFVLFSLNFNYKTLLSAYSQDLSENTLRIVSDYYQDTVKAG